MLKNRTDAGRKLAEKLKSFVAPQALVLAIPRGGVVVGHEIATILKLPLDILPVKKLSAPLNPEFAIGALAPDNVSYVEWRNAGNSGADEVYLREEMERVGEVLKQQEATLRRGRSPVRVKDRTVFLVDDGVATGSTIEAAIKWLRKKGVHRIIAALPVVAAATVKRIKPEVDELVVLETPLEFGAVGGFYETFEQVRDEEVVQLLKS